MRPPPLLVLAALLLAGCSAPEAPPPDAAAPAAPAGATPAAPRQEPETLAPPRILSPHDGATRVDGRGVTFQWSPAVSSRGTPVAMGVLLGGRPLAACPAAEGRTSCTVPLDPGQRLAWEVEATTTTGLRALSPQATFRTNAAPTPASPAFPPAGSHAMVPTSAFRFGAASDPDGDALTYVVEVRDARGSLRRLDCPLSGCVPRLPPGEEHSWRVVASDGLLTATSAEIIFRTDAPPTAPRPDPGDDGAVQVPMDLGGYAWQGSVDPDGDAVTYELRGSTAGRQAFSCSGLTTPLCAVPQLQAGQEYELRFWAVDAFGLTSGAVSIRLTTRLPVVFVHGWDSGPDAWEGASIAFYEAGYHVVDFSSVTGDFRLGYRPAREDETIPEIAATKVGPAIQAALVANGFRADQRVDVVAHSMGGLVMRTLIEQPGQYDLGFTIPSTWSTQVRTLTMVGTPNHGAWVAGPIWCSMGGNVDGVDVWYASCRQMEEGSAFLTRFLGEGPAAPTVEYHTISGGRDNIVGSESPRLGASLSHLLIPDACHRNSGCALTEHLKVFERLDEILGVRLGPA